MSDCFDALKQFREEDIPQVKKEQNWWIQGLRWLAILPAVVLINLFVQTFLEDSWKVFHLAWIGQIIGAWASPQAIIPIGAYIAPKFRVITAYILAALFSLPVIIGLLALCIAVWAIVSLALKDQINWSGVDLKTTATSFKDLIVMPALASLSIYKGLHTVRTQAKECET